MVHSSSCNTPLPLLPFSDLKHKVPILVPSSSSPFLCMIHLECLKIVERFVTQAWNSSKLCPQLVFSSLCPLFWNPSAWGPSPGPLYPPAANTHERVNDRNPARGEGSKSWMRVRRTFWSNSCICQPRRVFHLMSGKFEVRCFMVFCLSWDRIDEEWYLQNDGLGNSVDQSPG